MCYSIRSAWRVISSYLKAKICSCLCTFMWPSFCCLWSAPRMPSILQMVSMGYWSMLPYRRIFLFYDLGQTWSADFFTCYDRLSARAFALQYLSSKSVYGRYWITRDRWLPFRSGCHWKGWAFDSDFVFRLFCGAVVGHFTSLVLQTDEAAAIPDGSDPLPLQLKIRMEWKQNRDDFRFHFLGIRTAVLVDMEIFNSLNEQFDTKHEST